MQRPCLKEIALLNIPCIKIQYEVCLCLAYREYLEIGLSFRGPGFLNYVSKVEGPISVQGYAFLISELPRQGPFFLTAVVS